MKIPRSLCILGICTAMVSAALAHTDLATSKPGNGAVFTTAPGAIELGFTADVQLLKLQIDGSDSGEVASGFKPSAAKQQNFVVALPALGNDTYTVTWKVLGADGHQVEKSFSFTVDTAAQEQTNSVPTPSPHTEHAH